MEAIDHGDTAERVDDVGAAIDDWESALAAAGVDRYAEFDGVSWRRDLELVVHRESAAGDVAVHAGVLEAEPLVLVLVLVATDPADGSLRGATLTGRPVSSSQGPLVGEFGIVPADRLDALIGTFERAVATQQDGS